MGERKGKFAPGRGDEADTVALDEECELFYRRQIAGDVDHDPLHRPRGRQPAPGNGKEEENSGEPPPHTEVGVRKSASMRSHSRSLATHRNQITAIAPQMSNPPPIFMMRPAIV